MSERKVAIPLEREETPSEQAAPSGSPAFTVGIGAPAGGLDAREKFFNHLPPGTGMTIIIVTRIDPERPGMMLVHEESANLSPVDLDTVILEEIGNFPGAQVRYDGLPVPVCACRPLAMVFTNQIENAVRFCGPCVGIMVRVEEQDGKVLVPVEDTGPGSSDELKGILHVRFERSPASTSSGVWIEDRVPGNAGEGTAFCLVLEKADDGGDAG